MNDKLIIIGASGHGKVIADTAIKMKKWDIISFLDDDESIDKSLGLEVIGKTIDAVKYKDEADFFVAIGNNFTREKYLEALIDEGIAIANLIHPSAIIGTDVSLGIGTAVMAGVVINSSTRIGRGCIINTSCSLDHDNLIEDYVHISPGVKLAGAVKVGRGSWIGIGSAVINNVKICCNCIVGAGSLVIKDISEPGTYVGVPVRRVYK